tara:strand:+ start:1159 stop:3141 length:1983 start_codon:yes stop_codon:yes gene_type:complete
MKTKGYLFFHLNLAYSSIEEEAWSKVISNCYHPLLSLSEKTDIPIGIELTGWTLKQINRLDPSWVSRFIELHKKGNCELIGSGYCQIIAPLVPFKVNEWNQKLGLKVYKKILNQAPNIALVNEMAFSNSLVNLYSQNGYKGLIMDGDNIKLAINSQKPKTEKIPSHAIGFNDISMPVLWSDSILFQKVQHFTHGDICLDDYIEYLKRRINKSESIIPIYSNDAEVFDFRPGRFAEETLTHHDGEWNRFHLLLESIVSETGIEIILPSEALKINSINNDKSRLTNAAYPIPVKKQAKYNIARWAVTGRNDLWLNTMCHRIETSLRKLKNNNENDWKKLCELWASDLRTHITKKRWDKALNDLNQLLDKYKIDSNFFKKYQIKNDHESIEVINAKSKDVFISLNKEETLLCISTKKISLKLNLRRGLAIQSLAFSSHDMEPCIGTLPHGHFSCISLGADFYSGGLIAELPIQRIKVTDLEQVKPKIAINNNGDIEIYAEINTKIGNIQKLIKVSSSEENISVAYSFSDAKIIGSVRLGILTLLNSFSQNSEIRFANGGENFESFNFDGDFDHAKQASSFVSSSRGIGATTGDIHLKNKKNSIFLNWDTKKSAVMPMLQNITSNDEKLSRIIFSLQEVDDTLKEPVNLGSFELLISAEELKKT